MAAAVVKLYALADAVGTAAEDDDLAPAGDFHFIALLVGGVVVGRVGLEFAGAGVDEIVGGLNAEALAQAAHISFRAFPHFGQLSVGEAVFLGFAQHGREFFVPRSHVIGQAEIADVVFHVHDAADLAQEPGIDVRDAVNGVHVHSGQKSLAHSENAF